MGSTSLKTAKAPGQITVGQDSTGKHYMYVTGGGPGRHKLNLSGGTSKLLEQRGLKSGGEVSLSPQEARQLGVNAPAPGGAGTKGTQKSVSGVTPQQKSNPVLARDILHSHSRWVKSAGVKGKTESHARLQLMLGKGRREWLESAGAKPTEQHKAFAAAILGTIFARDVKTGKSGGGFHVLFSPGGPEGGGHVTVTDSSNKRVGAIKFKDLSQFSANNIEAARQYFGKAKEAYAQGKSAPKPRVKPTQSPTQSTDPVAVVVKTIKVPEAYKVKPQEGAPKLGNNATASKAKKSLAKTERAHKEDEKAAQKLKDITIAAKPIREQVDAETMKKAPKASAVVRNPTKYHPTPAPVKPPDTKPVSPVPEKTKIKDTTGLAAMGGGMAAAISENLRKQLHAEHLKGSTKMAGAEEHILQMSKEVEARGGNLKDEAKFKEFMQDYGTHILPHKADLQGTKMIPANKEGLRKGLEAIGKKYIPQKVAESHTSTGRGVHAYKTPKSASKVAGAKGVSYHSDFDRAAHVVRSGKYGLLLKDMMQQTGLSESQILQHGQKVHNALKRTKSVAGVRDLPPVPHTS